MFTRIMVIVIVLALAYMVWPVAILIGLAILAEGLTRGLALVVDGFKSIWDIATELDKPEVVDPADYQKFPW